MILTISGPAGTGKTVLAENLLARGKNFRVATNTTTRAPRPTDIAGDYTFVSDVEFDELLARGETILPFTVHDRRYATNKKIFESALASDDVYLWARMPQALVPLYESAGAQRIHIRSVFLCAPDEKELLRRLEARGHHDIHEIELRIKECRDWEVYTRGLPLLINFIPVGTPQETVEKVLALL